jgi:hypothetical protein
MCANSMSWRCGLLSFEILAALWASLMSYPRMSLLSLPKERWEIDPHVLPMEVRRCAFGQEVPIHPAPRGMGEA